MISAEQVKYTTALLIMAGLLQITQIFRLVGEDAWIVVLAATVVLTGILWLYKALLTLPGENFKGTSVFQYCFGPVWGQIVSALYILHIVISAALNMRNLTNVISGGMFTRLPVFVIPAIMALAAAYAARKGKQAIAALAFFLFVSVGLLQILDFALQLSQIRWENFFPMAQSGGRNFLWALFYCVTVPMGKVCLLLFFTPEKHGVKQKPRTGSFLWGALLGSLLMLLVVGRDTGVLGVLIRYMTDTIFEGVQLLEAFGFLSRVEIVFIFAFFIHTLFLIALCCSLSSEQLCCLLRLKDRRNRWVILGTAAAIFLIASFVCRTADGLRTLILRVQPFVSVWFLILLPAAALLAGKKKTASRNVSENGSVPNSADQQRNGQDGKNAPAQPYQIPDQIE